MLHLIIMNLFVIAENQSRYFRIEQVKDDQQLKSWSTITTRVIRYYRKLTALTQTNAIPWQ